MKHILFLIPFLFLSCAPKIVTINTETVRTEIQTIHDTVIDVRLDVIRDSVAVRDTFSRLVNKYAYSTAEWHSGVLNHSLVIKDVAIPIKVQYINTVTHDTTSKTIVQPLSKSDQNKLSNYDKVKQKASDRLKTVWKLIGIIALLGLWTFRKPLIWLISPKKV